ncbi:MAG: replicative DNA helicase [Spirochaetia bacterium]|nr:replicative DNA helicase [Spirochaetia bacterium]
MGIDTVLGKVPPHNIDAETAVLGAFLLDNEALTVIADYLRVDDFYRHSHQKIFSAIVSLFHKGEVVDIITLVEELKKNEDLEICGGISYVSNLTSSVPTSANVQYYADIVRSSSIRRQLLKISNEIISKAYDDTEDYKDILAEAEKKIFDITDESSAKSGYRLSSDVVNETINIIEKLYQAGGDYTGLPTGFPELDNLTSGFQKSDFIVIGARPSVGKTAFALSIASYMAFRKNIPIGFFTLEMAGRSLMQRLLSTESRIDLKKLRSGMLKNSDLNKLTEAAGRIYESPLCIQDTPNIKLLELRAQARRMKRNEDIQAIFIDYIGLIAAEAKGNVPRHEQVAEISRSLKTLARELDIPIICLSQVGRQSEGKEPTLADLRESGSIEQDADLVLFIHRSRGFENESKEEQQQAPVIETDVILAKQRNGPVDRFKLGFVKKYAKFESLTKEHP